MLEKKLLIKISPTTLSLYLLGLTFVLNMRTVWTAIPKYGRVVNLSFIMLLVGAAGYIFFRKKYKRHFINGVITTAALCAYLFIYYLHDEYKLGNFPSIIFYICVICLLCFAMREEHKKKLFEIIERIIIVIAGVSIFFWLFGSVAGILHPNGIEYTTWSLDGSEVPINKYYHLYFEAQVQNFNGFRIYRNSAIFTEGPMSSFMFCFAILVELFKKEHTNYKKAMFLAFCVATTFSTQGYIVVILALFIKYLFVKTHSSVAAVTRIALVPVALVALVIIADNLFQAKMDTASGVARVDDFVAGFKAWMDHPIMGNGYNNTMSYMQYMNTYRMNNTGFSNSVMQLLAFGGIYLFIPYVGSIAYGIFKIVRKRDWNELAFVSLFVGMFVFTLTTFQMLPLYTFFVLL